MFRNVNLGSVYQERREGLKFTSEKYEATQ